jgi:hypothetical protein
VVLRAVIQIKILRFTFLEKRRSRDFFTHTNQKSREKNLEKKNLEIFGGHLIKFFCEVNLEIFLEIFVSQDLRFVIHSSKVRITQNFSSFVNLTICVISSFF